MYLPLIQSDASYQWLAIMMFVGFFFILISGYPVAFSFAGTALVFALIGLGLGAIDLNLILTLPSRWFGVMSDYTLLAIPFFIFLGAVLEKSGLAEELLDTVGMLLGPLRGGIALAVVVVGTLLAATTGVVAATIIAMGMISLPTMLRYGYDKKLATGTIMAAGTLAQLIPPSLVLVLLSDQIGVSIGDLFAGALVPGLLMAGTYAGYALVVGAIRPEAAPAMPASERTLKGVALARRVASALLPTVLLIAGVLGAIFSGWSSPTEAGAIGAVFALLLALLKRRLSWQVIAESSNATLRTTALVIMILFCSSLFVIVFEGLGGSAYVTSLLAGLPGGVLAFMVVANIAIFLLGVFLEFVEITYIAMPLLVPAANLVFRAALRATGLDESSLEFAYEHNLNMVWFGIVMAVNLQIAFISPPVGFSLFYMQSVAPKSITTAEIHRSAIPYVIIQLVILLATIVFPEMTKWLVRITFPLTGA
jgi:tripartite ATP-independent transporter DctM subunit